MKKFSFRRRTVTPEEVADFEAHKGFYQALGYYTPEESAVRPRAIAEWKANGAFYERLGIGPDDLARPGVLT
ncbi:MAG: hypothetical protein ABIG68_05685 [Acidobacteriota bacterium]